VPLFVQCNDGLSVVRQAELGRVVMQVCVAYFPHLEHGGPDDSCYLCHYLFPTECKFWVGCINCFCPSNRNLTLVQLCPSQAGLVLDWGTELG